MKTLSVFAVSVLIALPLGAQEAVNDAVIAQIKTEGFQHSAVMDTLSWMSDVYGPRLTASPGLRKAAEWARDQLARWGLEGAALASYDPIGRGWELQHFNTEMTEPQLMRITGYPKAWSPATASPVAGTPIIVEVKNKQDFEKYRGTLRGAIVMNGRPEPVDIGFKPEATRLSEDDLKKKEGQIDPAPGTSPKTYWGEEADFDKYLTDAVDVWKFFGSEGVAALITPSPIAEDVRVDGCYDQKWQATYPAFVISREHYGRMMRMLDRKVPVKVSLSLVARFIGNVDGINVVAELPGTDLKDEVVMLGGHFDSWHSGTGATDNGAGSAVAMEAIRILKTIGVKPRRTIRLALWTGEEQDYFGSSPATCSVISAIWKRSSSSRSTRSSRHTSISTTAPAGSAA